MTDNETAMLFATLMDGVPYAIMAECFIYPNMLVVGGYLDDGGSYRIHTIDVVDGTKGNFPIEEVRPYLRPMNSISAEEFEELKELGMKANLFIDTVRLFGGGNNDIEEWFDKKHLDRRMLIEKGLAVSAPEWMYAFK